MPENLGKPLFDSRIYWPSGYSRPIFLSSDSVDSYLEKCEKFIDELIEKYDLISIKPRNGIDLPERRIEFSVELQALDESINIAKFSEHKMAEFLCDEVQRLIYIIRVSNSKIQRDAFGKALGRLVQLMSGLDNSPYESASIKKHLKIEAVKMRAIQIAMDYWKEDDTNTTSIKDMTDTVRKILSKEDHKYTKKTIRSWITDYAPEDAHKPGRPRRK